MKLVLEAERLAIEISMAVEKARCMSSLLFEDYFGYEEITSQEEARKISFHYPQACIEFGIENDYLCTIEAKIKEMLDIISKMDVSTKEGKVKAA